MSAESYYLDAPIAPSLDMSLKTWTNLLVHTVRKRGLPKVKAINYQKLKCFLGKGS